MIMFSKESICREANCTSGFSYFYTIPQLLFKSFSIFQGIVDNRDPAAFMQLRTDLDLG